MKYDSNKMNLPWVQTPFFRELLPQKCATQQEADDATFFHENGCLILKNVVSGELADRIRDETRGLFRPDIPAGPRCVDRVYAGWRESPAVGELAGHSKILAMLRFLYGREPVPFQTLEYRNGSELRAHCDSIHYSSLPPRFMCAVWVALEDVTLENGPLFYYPGSHQLPEFNGYDLGTYAENVDYEKYQDFMEDLTRAHGFPKKQLLARKGDVMIWASNLIHGGEKILHPGSTRWSQITHYYFEDCLYYTPLHSNLLSGELRHLEIRNLTTGKFVEQTYNGKPFSALPTGYRSYRITERFRLLGKMIAQIRRGFCNFKSKAFAQPSGYRG